MPYVCPLCLIDPSNHSLIKIKETDTLIIFYTCPSQAKLYFDCESIINHYNGIFNEIPQNKKWIWVFDSKGFGFNHLTQTKVAIELTKLITKFSTNLINIIVINPCPYIYIIYNTLIPFLNNKILNIISFDYDNKDIPTIIKHFDDLEYSNTYIK